MACPTCDRTMQNLGLDQAGRRAFWCPTCGTLNTDTVGTFTDGGGNSMPHAHENFERPKLVPLTQQLIRAVQAADHARVNQLMSAAKDLARAIEHSAEASGANR